MTPDLDTLFLKARELTSPEKRATYLDAACAGDVGLRARLEQMLADVEATDSFFGSTTAAPPTRLEAGEGPGTMIGRYRLLESIGEGGMGSVYLAEQREPVDRKVALKIIKLGMDTREVIARFEAERQALASLDHPAIAKILDGGATSTGRPYFVMELVQGLPITQFCDERHLSTESRLELFIAVCQAIQHAHQKGIIHRDIKPSNILVTLDGDRPLPKVIDFGIAKATGQRLTDKTLFTHFREFIGTPAYMSPEQANLSALDIDTRSDIYSLGVLLYELLTGKTPFESGTLLKAGMDEIRRIIRETDPPKPSTRLNSLGVVERTTVARARQIEPGRLRKFLRGDLDWIVMKALEKDRSRRYDSASGLAADLQRHLQSEAVLAAPPGAWYRLQKFTRRHRAGLLSTAIVAGVMVAATAVSVWQAIDASRARRTALDGRAEAEAVSNFLIDVFRSPDPARDGRTITVAEMLSRASSKVESNLAHVPDRQARLLATLGATTTALGLPRDAIPLEEKARDFYRDQHGLEDPRTLTVMQNLAQSYFQSGQGRQALALNREVARLRRKVLGEEHADTLTSISNLANICEAADLGPEALALREEVLAKRRRTLGPTDRDTLLAMNNLGNSYFSAGHRTQALELRQSVLALSRQHLGEEDLGTIRAMQALAISLFDANRKAEALALREDVVRLRRKLLGPDHSDTLGAMADLIRSYSADNRPAEALRLSEEVLALCRKTLGSTHAYTLRSMDNLAISLAEAGRPDEALAQRESLLSLSREILGAEALGTLKTANLLAGSYAEAGRGPEALKLREDVMAIRLRAYAPDHPDTILASEDLAQSFEAAGRHADALPWRESVLTHRQKQLQQGHPDTLQAMNDLAATLEALGQLPRAAALREQARSAAATPNKPGR